MSGLGLSQDEQSRFGVMVSFWIAILGTHHNQSRVDDLRPSNYVMQIACSIIWVHAGVLALCQPSAYLRVTPPIHLEIVIVTFHC